MFYFQGGDHDCNVCACTCACLRHSQNERAHKRPGQELIEQRPKDALEGKSNAAVSLLSQYVLPLVRNSSQVPPSPLHCPTPSESAHKGPFRGEGRQKQARLMTGNWMSGEMKWPRISQGCLCLIENYRKTLICSSLTAAEVWDPESTGSNENYTVLFPELERHWGWGETVEPVSPLCTINGSGIEYVRSTAASVKILPETPFWRQGLNLSNSKLEECDKIYF